MMKNEMEITKEYKRGVDEFKAQKMHRFFSGRFCYFLVINGQQYGANNQTVNGICPIVKRPGFLGFVEFDFHEV